MAHHDPAIFTHGLTQPFDLVAPGGADDVWLTQVGDVDRWGSFVAFAAAAAAARIDVADLGGARRGHRGFDVAYASPAEGALEVGGG